MDCFNNDSDFHPRTALAAEEPEIYSFLNRMSALAIEEARNCAYDVPVNRLGVAESGSAFNCQTSFGATPSYESVVLATPYTNRIDDCLRSLSTGQRWPEHQARSQLAGSLNDGNCFENSFSIPSENPFAATLTAGAPIVLTSSLNSSPKQDVRASCQHGTGPTRVKLVRRGRFQPYGTPRAHTMEHIEAGAGPSTIVPPRTPCAGFSTLHLFGGLSETTGDAANDHRATEDDKAPEPERRRVPRGKGKPRPHRIQMKGSLSRLCDWVKKRGCPTTPSFEFALSVALEEVRKIRSTRSDEPCLLTGETNQAEALTRSASKWRAKRGTEIRELFLEISRYYPRSEGEVPWACATLLGVVVNDLEESTMDAETL